VIERRHLDDPNGCPNVLEAQAKLGVGTSRIDGILR
jgi:hypothetical protein